MAFKDSMDRRMDSDLKKIFLMSGWILRPALALSSVSQALKVWLAGLESSLAAAGASSKIEEVLQELNISADFLREASIDMVRMSARAMSHSVTARRALWLRHWNADSTSKQALCSIPFEGRVLFGKHLEEAISRATGGKSALLPQSRFRRSFRQSQPHQQQRFRDARQYRPGRFFGKSQWKNSSSSYLRSLKTKTGNQGKDVSKSF